MCGIVGFITRPEKGPDLAAAMHRPLGALAPRGPDDEGVWIDPLAGVALGARRLAVTDLSDNAQQPMVSADGRWHVVFNGHIAGHRSLRKRFLSGQSFPSDGDTATLVALISELGLPKSCHIWKVSSRLPLGTRTRRRCIWPGTALEYVLWCTARPRKASGLPRRSGLGLCCRVLTFGWTRAKDIFASFGWVPAPMTIFGQARSVLPGQRLEVRANGQLEQEMWWSEPAAVELAGDQTIGADAIEAIIDASIREQLEAERGVGLFLSGGIDSSIIASSSAVREAVLPAFVATFPDAECFDESHHAQEWRTPVVCRSPRSR